MNTNYIENIILELNQISDLWYKIEDIQMDIGDLELDKSSELRKTEKAQQTTINRSLVKFKKEQLKKLPKWKVSHEYISKFEPNHWHRSSKIPDWKAEKSLNTFSSPEMKMQVYNTFREYEKSFVKIMKECEAKAKTEWDAYHSELTAIDSKYEKKKEELNAKQDALRAEMNKYTVINSSLFYIAREISLLLSQKRADTLKEAINLAIDERRKKEESAESHWHNREMEKLAEEELRVKKEQAAAAQYQADTMKATIEAQCNRCAKRLFCSRGTNRPLNCKDFERR